MFMLDKLVHMMARTLSMAAVMFMLPHRFMLLQRINLVVEVVAQMSLYKMERGARILIFIPELL